MTNRAETLLEGAATALIARHGLVGMHATERSPRFAGEPLTLTNGDGSRSFAVELRVQEITGWEDER